VSRPTSPRSVRRRWRPAAVARLLHAARDAHPEGRGRNNGDTAREALRTVLPAWTPATALKGGKGLGCWANFARRAPRSRAGQRAARAANVSTCPLRAGQQQNALTITANRSVAQVRRCGSILCAAGLCSDSCCRRRRWPIALAARYRHSTSDGRSGSTHQPTRVRAEPPLVNPANAAAARPFTGAVPHLERDRRRNSIF
jgi:hypothetical protein